MTPPDDGHVWYSIEDPKAKTTWLFDTTFLLSSYQCLYGNGCPSIDRQPDPSGTLGCCTHGAHLVDQEDRRDVEERAAQLSADEWQFHGRAAAKGGAVKKIKGGDWVTRKVNGACIFLNRHGFPGGAGCALHLAAERRGDRPMDWKPDVCWQVPIRLDIHTDDYDHETVMIRGWQRRDWGPGGDDFHWWCLESPSAFTAAVPLYVSAADELIEMVGRTVYGRLKAHLDTLARSSGPVVTPVVLSDRAPVAPTEPEADALLRP